MLWRRWGAPIAGNEVKDGQELVENAVALGEHATIVEWNPCSCSSCVRRCYAWLTASLTLIFAISTLHLFVHTLLDLALEDARAGGLVEVGDLQDVGCVDPVVGATAHDMVALNIELIDGDLSAAMMSARAVWTQAGERAGGATGGGSSRCCRWPSRSCRWRRAA